LSNFFSFSDTLTFAIIKDKPNEKAPEDQFIIVLKSKGTMMKSRSTLEPKGGRGGKSLRVRAEIKKNVILQLPMNLLGKILSLKFINSSIKIDIHDHTVVRFIFRFKPQMAQGSLYYNIGQMNGENISGEAMPSEDQDYASNEVFEKPQRKKRKSHRNSVVMSYRDMPLTDEESD